MDWDEFSTSAPDSLRIPANFVKLSDCLSVSGDYTTTFYTSFGLLGRVLRSLVLKLRLAAWNYLLNFLFP